MEPKKLKTPKRDLFRTRRIPNSLAKMIHLERLADDAHIRAVVRKEKATDEVCRCVCHAPGMTVMHCRPCCHTCPKCGARIKEVHYDTHRSRCGTKGEQ